MRIKLTPENLPAFIAAITKMEAEIVAAGHETFMNGLFVAMGGGSTEAGTYYLKSITSSVETHGAVIDDYFAGASWGATYNEASAMIDEVVNDQFDVCDQFYTANRAQLTRGGCSAPPFLEFLANPLFLVGSFQGAIERTIEGCAGA